jgi:hypothetical protein
LGGVQRGDEQVQPLALFDGLDQSAFLGADGSERVLEMGPPLPCRFPPRPRCGRPHRLCLETG